MASSSKKCGKQKVKGSSRHRIGYHHFHSHHGQAIKLTAADHCRTAERDKGRRHHGLVFSAAPLTYNEVFEVEITASNTSWSDQLRIGLTTSSPSSESLRKIPVPEDYGGLPPNTWMMVKMKGGYILHCNGSLTKDQYRVDYPDQFNLRKKDRIGVSYDDAGKFHLHHRGDDLGPLDAGMSLVLVGPLYAVLDIYGNTNSVSITTNPPSPGDPLPKYSPVTMTTSTCPATKSLPTEVVDPQPIASHDVSHDTSGPSSHDCHMSCSYWKKCQRYLNTMNIPEVLFDSTPLYNKCYCKKCNPLLIGVTERHQGQPPTKYTVDSGWAKFALKMPPQAIAREVFSKWHVAYHGTSKENLPNILLTGYLLMQGDRTLNYTLTAPETHYSEDRKPPGFNVRQIFITPSIKYSSIPVYSEWDKLEDGTKAQIILKLKIHPNPGSYSIKEHTLKLPDPTERIDPYIDNDKIEWCTDVRGGHYLYAVMIHLHDAK